MNRGAKLLIVDDDQQILDILVKVFDDLHRVTTTTCAHKALSMISKAEFDVVISDLKMPKMSGIDFLSRVKNLHPRTARIILSGVQDVTETIKAVNLSGIYAYHPKPFRKNLLLNQVKEAFNQKKIKDQRHDLLQDVIVKNKKLQNSNVCLKDEISTHLEEINHGYESSIKVLSSLLQRREGLINNLDVADLANVISVQMGLTQETTQQIYFAGLLHSIGLISLPDKVIHKNINSLSQEEFTLYSQYPVISSYSLMALSPLAEAADMIRYHRELYDGTGFPHGMKGSEIPLASSILSLAIDFYMLKAGLLMDAKLTTREAINFIQEHANIRYPKNVVDTFSMVMKYQGIRADNRKIMPVEASSLQPGMVVQSDIFSDHKVLLIPKGHVLTEANITNLLEVDKNSTSNLTCYVKV